MDEIRLLGVACPQIVTVERLEEAPVSLETDKGPITVVEACEQERNLINLVRRYPALYDGQHPRFHDDTYKEQLWKRITSQLHIELTQCLVTWSELRYRYQRHVRRLRAFHRSAVKRRVKTRRRPCLRHEEELLFLYPHVARFPLLKLEVSDSESESEDEGDGVPEVVIVEPPPVDIIDVDLVDDAIGCTMEERCLIEAVKAYPQLYDAHHPQFSNFRHRGLIWCSISNELRDKATKLIKNWLILLTRFEWDVRHNDRPNRDSELCHRMAFMRQYVMRLRLTVCQVSKYLQNSWYEPIENFRSVLALINAMRTMPELVQITEDCQRLRTKPTIYDELWQKVGQAVDVSYERCEVTWLLLRSFHTELTAMRQAGYQLQDKWYFENVLNGIVRLAAVRAAKRITNNKRPHNGDETGEMGPPPAKVTPPPAKVTPAPAKVTPPPAKVTPPPAKVTQPPAKVTQPPAKVTVPSKITQPEPPRFPIAIVYPPSMKTNSSSTTTTTATNNSSTTTGSGQSLPNARSSTAGASTLPAATSSSSSTATDHPMPFVISTSQGNVKVSAVPRPPPKLLNPIKNISKPAPGASPANQAPNAMHSLVQRPAPQISMRPKMNAPLPNIPITLPTSMIRAITPPAAAVVSMQRNGSSSSASLGSSISLVRVQPAAGPGTTSAPTRPKLPKLLPKPPEMAAPMVRIHQPVLISENDIGKTLSVSAARGGAAKPDTGRGIGTAGGGAVAGAAAGAPGKSAGTGAGVRVVSGAVVGGAIKYPEVATTSSGSKAPPKAPTILRGSGISLPPVVLSATKSNRIVIRTSDATSQTPTIASVTSAARPATSAAPLVTAAARPATSAAPPATPAAPPATSAPPPATSAAPPVTSAAPPVTSAPPPVTRSASPVIIEVPSVDPDDAPSTSKSISTDFGQSPRGIFMNAINVNLVYSASAGNSLRIWGGGLNCNYNLNMVRTATLIREVMAVPQLHNKCPQLKAQSDEFWQVISQKFHMPELALRACWNFLANNMSLFPSIAPMTELMRPFKGNLKVWEKSNRLFGKFDEIARKYDWMKYREVIPDLIRHFRHHEHLYWEMRKPRPGEVVKSPPLYTERERQEVWREAKIKFPDLNHHDIWSMFKFAFRTYMEDLERGIDNPWPQNWWQALEQLKFLADIRYHPLEPYFYIVHNKILDEVKRCSMFEALTSSDSTDKGKTSALLARVAKEPMPWCSEEAKRLLTGKLSILGKPNNANASSQATVSVPVPVIDIDSGEIDAPPDIITEEPELPEPVSEPEREPEPEPEPKPEPEPEPEPQPSCSRSIVRRPPKASGSRPTYTLPTIEVFELTRMLRRYPHTFQRVHTINKRTAWVRVSKELKITVTECRLGLQYALREMRLLKILDPKNLCTMNHKYFRHMDEIFKQVKNKSQLTVRTPEQMNESVAVEQPEEMMSNKFVPEINMSTCKPSLVLKNWATAIGSLPEESQDVLAIKLKYLFAKFAKMNSHNTS
ncbi:uncharacterized protein LOC110181903 [Drosophila serrata]|uniref:uncharacterized protein LOC110181903 n=1 Tax=Drosophila serrata TaxID=7274 RepID=UPI000A1D2888|nr:uncharacterized protein LOC110181903 [Drosophila serrata]